MMIASSSAGIGSSQARDGGTGPSLLRFTGASGSVELQESDDGWAGMLEPAADGEVSVLGPDGTLLETAPIDELGTFFIAATPGGPIRLRCRTSSGETRQSGSAT